MKHYLLTTLLLALLACGLCNAQQSKKAISKSQPVISKETYPGLIPGNTGSVTFPYQGTNVTYVTVRAKDGNIWLQQNLGSKKVASTYNDEDSLGDLFQWGRWDDGHQLIVSLPDTRNEAPNPNNPAGLDKQGTNPFYYQQVNTWWLSGDATDNWTAATPAQATATNGCDPCRLIGEGWRLPTKEEMKNVYTLEHITDGYGGARSNLKLPCAGYRLPQAPSVMERGTAGIYWTSTAAKAAAFGMEWGPSAGTTFRGYAFALRCMRSKINQ